ncbi:hypothetical protein CDEF62S_04730 [Castellaniella defragrans]
MMPFEREKRYMRTMGSNQEVNVAANMNAAVPR